MIANRNLNDVGCWLEQAEAIVELIAHDLEGNSALGSAISLSLYGAVSLIGRAREVAEAENIAVAKEGRTK